MVREKHFLKILNKLYPPDSLIDMTYKGHDMSFKTDKEGNPVLLFIGERKDDGFIRGSRFTRVLVKDREGRLLKDHWEFKGKAS